MSNNGHQVQPWGRAAIRQGYNFLVTPNDNSVESVLSGLDMEKATGLQVVLASK